MGVPIFWIALPTAGRLGIMARPRGNDWLDDDLRALGAAGVDVLVSLLTLAEEWELQLDDEARLCDQHGIVFVSFPIPDRTTPPLDAATSTVIRRLTSALNSGQTVVAHCRMGIGRSSLVAASVLTLCGIAPAVAFAAIERARGCPVPDTPEQRAWVDAFASADRVRAAD